MSGKQLRIMASTNPKLIALLDKMGERIAAKAVARAAAKANAKDMQPEPTPGNPTSESE